MTRFVTGLVIALIGLLFAAPSKAGNYGGYGGYGGYNNYRFSYYPTIPTYNYGYQNYYTPSYYTPTYYAPSYTPSYASTNYYDGNYHYHSAGTYQGVWYPAGNYAWQNGAWVGQGASLATPIAPKDWKDTLLQVASKRDEYATYLAALKSMGVSPPPESPAGGFAPRGMGYGVNRNYNLGTYGANASTLYGYSVKNVQDLYGDASTASLFQQANQLATNAQALGGEATKQFQSNVAQDGANRTRMAEALARGLAASEALRAAQGSESHQSSSTTTYGADQGQQGGPSQPPPQQQPPQPQAQPRQQGAGQQLDPAWIASAKSDCLRCHDPSKTNGNKFEGRFDVTRYYEMPLKERQERVWPRLMHHDAAKRMPQDAPPLPPEKMVLWFK